MSDYVVIYRDSFARLDVIRKTVYLHKLHKSTCEWCGNPGKLLANGTRRLFRYGIYEDGLLTSPQFDSHLFCSKSCYSAYHG